MVGPESKRRGGGGGRGHKVLWEIGNSLVIVIGNRDLLYPGNTAGLRVLLIRA